MINGYRDERMNLNDVCKWLTDQGYEDIADIMLEMFTNHIWTVDGMLRKDVIQDCIVGTFGDLMFKKLECDVITYMNVVPLHEAHVD